MSSVSNYCIYADLIGFDSPSIMTDTENRPDCILRLTGEHGSRELYIIELTVGFETNLQKNALRKKAKYSMLLSHLRQKFDKVFFVNLSLSALGFYGSSCSSFTDMLKHLKFTEEKRYLRVQKNSRDMYSHNLLYFLQAKQTMDRACRRNKPWTEPAGETNHGQSLQAKQTMDRTCRRNKPWT